MLGEVGRALGYDRDCHVSVPASNAGDDPGTPIYQACAVHRAAGLADQRNIELVAPTGAWFGQQAQGLVDLFAANLRAGVRAWLSFRGDGE